MGKLGNHGCLRVMKKKTNYLGLSLFLFDRPWNFYHLRFGDKTSTPPTSDSLNHLNRSRT